MGKPTADEHGMSPLERGRRRYQEKDYPAALKAFTEAVDMSTEHLLLTALDYRAATYEKLEQLQPALRDAKKMLDLKPELSKGYLRCGKILQLKGETELALKIYERGLRKVKIGNDNDRVSIFNKLRQAQDPGKTRDPLQFLPLELAEIICQYLAVRDRVICLAVSRSWKRLLESSHKLWTTLDTTYARKPINQASLRAHLRRSNYTLDHAIITSKACFDAQKMTYIAKNCKQLRRLEIHGSGVIGESLTDSVSYAKSLETVVVSKNCEITIQAVQNVLKACKDTLVEAHFLNVKSSSRFPANGWPQLQLMRAFSLKSMGNYGFSWPELLEAIISAQSITLNGFAFLDIADVTRWNDLRRLDLSNTGMRRIPKLPPTITHLILFNNPHLERFLHEGEESKLPLLEVLDCRGTAMPGSFIKTLTQESIMAGNLKALSIGDRLVEYRNGPVRDEYPSSETVEGLSLANLLIWEERLIQVVNLYPNLLKLDVSGTKITGVAVKHFVNMGIKSLKLNECREISGDAVEWARGQGVEVEQTFSSQSHGRRFLAHAFVGAW